MKPVLLRAAPKYFPSAPVWRNWLTENYDKQKDLIVGFYKVTSGKKSMTVSEAIDEALCFGWIDSISRSIDSESYSLRFCPRRKGSIWSKINIAKVEKLIAAGKLMPVGLEKYEQRLPEKVGVYSHEQSVVYKLDAAMQNQFEANSTAWDYFKIQTEKYKQRSVFWICSAKQLSTQEGRLLKLITASAERRKI